MYWSSCTESAVDGVDTVWYGMVWYDHITIPDEFITAYEEMTARQNTRLTKSLKPDMKEYNEKKEKM